MSAQYQGLIAELSANATIPGKQLEAIMTAYPTCWGYAAPVEDKQGNKKLLMAATKIPDGWSAKDIQDMKAELRGTPEMMEYFGKFSADTDDVCMQPFPCLEDDKGNTLLCLFLEGDFDHWAKPDEPHHTPEYICYRDKISPLVNKFNKMLNGNVAAVVKELGSTEIQDILEGTFADRGVMYFLSNAGHSQMIEGGNDKRKDEDWGSLSNEVPEVQGTTDSAVEEVMTSELPEMSLAEKRKLRQAQKEKVKSTPEGVHTTEATPKSVTRTQNTTISEQAIKEKLNSSTAVTAKGPFLITLPSIIRTVEEALTFWKTNFGTCPNEYKIKQADGTWLPSYKAGFPYEKLAKGSALRDKYNTDGSPKSTGKGFAALDDVATGKGTDTKGPDGDSARSGPAQSRIPLMPVAVRDKVIEEIVKLDLKSRPIMSNDEVKDVEKKLSSVYAQLNNMEVEDTFKMSFEEIDKLNKTYPDFGSVWLFALRNFQKLNWKTAQPEPKQEEPTKDTVKVEELGMTLAEKRAARKKAAAAA
jgi:hypothetical protein